MSKADVPELLRRTGLFVWFLVFYWLLFVFVPAQLIDWNTSLGWPVWQSGAARVSGAALIAAGVGVILYCSGLFAVVGFGTPIPIAPPTTLVVQGLFRFSRNPIYVADVAVWLGLFLWHGQLALLLLVVGGALLIHGFVVLVEEPGLRGRFGADYDAYRAAVPRWIGRRIALPQGDSSSAS